MFIDVAKADVNSFIQELAAKYTWLTFGSKNKNVIEETQRSITISTTQAIYECIRIFDAI